MRTYLIVLICLFTFACSNKIDGLFEKNREDFSILAKLLKENNHIFFNKNKDVHRVFFTYVFSNEYEKLPEASDWKNIDKELYTELRKLINKLDIKQFYISNKGNIYFKMKEEDFFVKSNNYYLGFSEENSFKEDMTSFGGCKIDNYHRIDSKWYSIICSYSPAN